ncbi:MAG: calcium-translocating P-type ATPase, PMCA-type [Massiliimalia sp.]|jgi:Ca2+-transporting ATPase
MKILSLLEQDYHQQEAPASDEILGLTSAQAEQKLKQYGKNVLKQRKKTNPLKIFLNQYRDILTIILLISTVVSIFLGEYVEAFAIAVIVLMNGIMGFLQEYKTEKTLEALKQMTAPTARVYRDGKWIRVAASDTVPGDVIRLETGDRIPADSVLMECQSMETDESILTGESQPVAKSPCEEMHRKNELNQADVVYMGTTVVKGHGTAKIIATGMETQMGKIAHMLHEIQEEDTQLQKKLGQLGKYIAIGCLIVCCVVSAAGILRGEPALNMLITGLSLAVAAVPEGLPAIVTIALALAVGRMVKQHALVRKLHAVETLGCTTVICSDKTGTLTQNSMTAVEMFVDQKRIRLGKHMTLAQESSAWKMAECALLCNNSMPQNGGWIGEPTEVALAKFAVCCGMDQKDAWKRLEENPFDSRKKYMSVTVEDSHGQRFLMMKGAFDVILEKCTYMRYGQENRLLSAEYRNQIQQANEQMAGQALRVIGFAMKPLTSGETASEEGLIFLGLIGMIDPPRPEVKAAVEMCRKAGIKTVMITGDHKITACAIAKEIGIFRDQDRVLDGKELDAISQDELEQVIDKVTVFARVSPKHKLRIVTAFQKKGHVAAMTGDGVNDAPAVKQADIGVSMGKSGTDVTKEASDIVLLDDNFSTLVSAVKEGRVIYSNIRKFIRYLLSCNIGEVLTMFFGMLMGMPVILLPIQILLVNLVTDGLPAIALGLEPPEKDVMSRRPRKKNEGIFSDGLLSKIVFRGFFIGLSTLASFTTVYRMTGDLSAGRTAAYFTLVVTQLINVFECKSEHHTLFSIHLGSNPKLIGAVLVSLTVLLLSIYLSPLQLVLNTVSLGRKQLLVVLGYCMIPTVLSSILVSRSGK